MTGAAGWLGSRLVETLIQGSPDWQWMPRPSPQLHVRCLVLPHEDASLIDRLGDRVEIVRGDITRPADCARLCEGAGGAILFHIAGIIHPRRRAEFYKVNLDGTRNVLRASIAAGVRR
ncbi:MAG: NAD-dependent epimerase/dehydratase family protein, partial [Longimicrobiales bacterium]